MDNYTNLENSLGYKFKNIDFLVEALTHSSFSNENKCTSNERLEFLGDSVLDLCMGRYLFKMGRAEGDMTKMRATYVCEEALVIYSTKLGLNDFLKLGIGEEANGGRYRDALVADAFEAVLGAVFLDSNFDTCCNIFERIVLPYLELVDVSDYKSKLQEFLATDRRTIQYKLVSESGPPHDKTYEFSAVLENNIVLGIGFGKTKKDAEQSAAKEALKKIAK